MFCNELEALTCAKLLVSGYPNSAMTDPEFYITQLVAVFVQYDREMVRRAVSPAGIPFTSPKFLPAVGEVNKYLAEKQEYADRMAAYKPLPKPNVASFVPITEPNLFVPQDAPDYDAVVQFVGEANPKYYRLEEHHYCHDGRIAAGYWVPNDWWVIRHNANSAARWK